MSALFRRKNLGLLTQDDVVGADSLKRTLSAWQLMSLGVGAIIGAGLFSLTGIVASEYAGPAVVLSFILAAIGCGLAGMCYSEMASMIPRAGSAYTYAYATMGEFVAWVIGWELTLEYAIGASTVSVSWSRYFVKLLHQVGLTLPPQLSVSPWDTIRLADGTSVAGWFNLPALVIVILISLLLMRGIQESARVTMIIVIIKVAVVLTVIAVGAFYIDTTNYVPFIPPNEGGSAFGISGVISGAGVIFFAYIGFDAVSTAAQETKNPQRDMAIGILGSLAICTVIYMAFSLVLTGVVNYHDLKGDAAPVATAISKTPFPWLQGLVTLGALSGLTTVILVMLLGQSRVFYAMSVDGLLPEIFRRLHPEWRTPWISNVIFMVFSGVLGSFVPISKLGELTSIGTLMAFIIVCLGVMILRYTAPDQKRGYRTPFVPFVPLGGIFVCGLLIFFLDDLTKISMLIWTGIGIPIYFLYSRQHSRLNSAVPAE